MEIVMEQNMQNQGRNICYCRRCRGIVHQVQRGDTLYAMSRHYGVPVGEIISANPFINIYNLRIGQEICIPIRTPQPRTGMMNTRGMEELYSDNTMNSASGNNNRTQNMNNGMEPRSEFMETEEVEPRKCCQNSMETEEEYSESSQEEMQQMSRDNMVLTGEEKLSDVLAQYDMDIEDFVKCISREK